MVRGDWTRQGGRRAMHALMALADRPDAVFCANDLTAIGAVDAARDLGLAIPGDVAVVGFDDVDAATIVSPTLTTVRNPAYDTGCAAGELLLSRMLGALHRRRRTNRRAARAHSSGGSRPSLRRRRSSHCRRRHR